MPPPSLPSALRAQGSPLAQPSAGRRHSAAAPALRLRSSWLQLSSHALALNAGCRLPRLAQRPVAPGPDHPRVGPVQDQGRAHRAQRAPHGGAQGSHRSVWGLLRLRGRADQVRASGGDGGEGGAWVESNGCADGRTQYVALGAPPSRSRCWGPKAGAGCGVRNLGLVTAPPPPCSRVNRWARDASR